MDKWSFGLTLLVVGVTGTFLTLWLLALAVNLLKRIFPLPPEEKQ
ncbi:MAG TPA: OadG-related small transporter subunit [Burkholderiales bacterium]|nr:OadG-related small transporter subunit [Burkholderiales bacterium]